MTNCLNTTPEEHDCRIIWKGVSEGMDAGVALELYIAMHDDCKYSIFIEYIVLADDSTIRAHLTHDDKGKISLHIPIPTFLADHSHCIKVISTPIFKLKKGDTINQRECKKIDALRIKKYTGCYIYQNRNLPLVEMAKKSKAPVEHLFN